MAKRAQRGVSQPSPEATPNDAHQRRRDPESRGAWTNGMFLLLGVLLTVGLTHWSAERLQADQVEREDRQDRRDQLRQERAVATEARGAARMLIAEMLGTATQMAILDGDRVLRHFDPTYRISIPHDDMRLIASRIAPEAWGSVMAAVVSTNDLASFVNSQIERGRHVLTDSEACYTRLDLRAIRYAAEALADLADAPGQPPPPKPIRCKPGPGPLPPDLRRRLEAAGVAIGAPPLRPGETAP